MKVLVTGGAGDIGRYVVRDLLDHGLSTTILDVRPAPQWRGEAGYVQCDLMDLAATLDAVRGYDVVIHLAAIPHPYNDPLERVMAVNMVTAFNVLEAVYRNGIPRIVYGCSESSSGFGIHNVELRPLYLPIDEGHPCWPHESYSLTKRFGEEMVENYAIAYGIEAISLRYCWVWLERDRAGIERIVAASADAAGERDAKAWFGCYIAPHDVAQACRLSALYEFPAEFSEGQRPPFEAFYLTAETTYLQTPTLEALRAHFDPLPNVRDETYFDQDPFAPPFDTRKAQRLLGFKPTKDWRAFAEWDLE